MNSTQVARVTNQESILLEKADLNIIWTQLILFSMIWSKTGYIFSHTQSRLFNAKTQ